MIFLKRCCLVFTGIPSVIEINCGRFPKGFITAIIAIAAKNTAYIADSILVNIVFAAL